ncbi:MAG: Nif3-like dinuclear metal center hexameric protein [Bacteroidota bacterium]|nr:Nif3-like dinuclear metal center hexameric protein [Bacteroidota bacterium]MDP4210980.1 Nif3-like dinuclear metal center hexameric protein [Bacteroidota bacterium]MDP4248798.1 Nif3-like dinuclear metal center hexameric protein [Bacteroidota bacterium]
MKIADISSFLETLAPLAFQEDYDNCGLLLGNAEDDCRGILISLDTTEAIISEAVQKSCNLVISHHPLIFRGLRQVNPRTATGRTVMAAIQKQVAVCAIHTNLDNVLTGVNGAIADKLGLMNRRLLLPKPAQIRAGIVPGSGLFGELPESLSEKQFLELLQAQFRIPVIRHSMLTGKPVRRVALCGGAGSFMITNALHEGADFFVTSDIRYHEFFEAEGRLVITDIGHYESEQFTQDLLHDAILKKFPNFAVLKAGAATNPVHYYL